MRVGVGLPIHRPIRRLVSIAVRMALAIAVPPSRAMIDVPLIRAITGSLVCESRRYGHRACHATEDACHDDFAAD